MIIQQRKNHNTIKITKKILRIKDTPQVILLQHQNQIAIKKTMLRIKISPIQIKNLEQRQQEQRKTINISMNDSTLIFAYNLLNKKYIILNLFSSIITPISLQMLFLLEN